MLLPRSLLRTHATAAVYAARNPSVTTRAFYASAALRAIDMSKVDTTGRLAELRKLMKERNVDIYSTKPRSSNAEHSLTHMQWCHPKTATKASTLPLATPVEVRSPAACHSTPIDFLQHISAASLALRAMQSLRTIRLPCPPTDDTSTRLKSNSTPTGSSLSRASRMFRPSRNGPWIGWREARSLQ